MYIHHAQNIADGRPYADTGYIYNPAVPVYGPRMYPPVFPLLLAPVYKVFGLSLMPMKVEQVLFVVLTLITLSLAWRRRLGTGYSLLLVAILGFSPAFCSAKNDILSDLPFLFFFYLAVLLLDWSPRHENQNWIWAALLGLTLYLAIGTRTAGITLLPGVLLFQWLQHRRINRFTVVALCLCAVALVGQAWFVGTVPGGYLEQLHSVTAKTVVLNAVRYSRTLAGFWVGGVPNAFSFFVIAIVALLTLAGLLPQRDRKLSAVECLLLPYCILMLLWPFGAGIRYALPLVPWIVFLALSGLRELSTRFCQRYSASAPCALLLLIAVAFTQAYRATNFGPIRENTGLAEFNELCETVRQITRSDDVFIYSRARALSLYTGRPASTYNRNGTETELSEYLQRIHANYLVTTNAFSDGEFLSQFVQGNPNRVDLIYQNLHFNLYRVRPVVAAPNVSISR